ncbi:NAD(P)H-binding protein [Burkholderiaceae bacterium FT117]|uniref:NAD(P)H-binding protein n=1 Tax=Zeimonas sediminis TaxID=2944268 RepID=UPI002342E472|nr:NAD(P)H-binding protein [Zeimonas sediminis]MCM5570046.1 NAD(P)H-binding protein [Zeimonas sediminis]
MKKTLLVLGATGQVGAQVLRLALADDRVGRVVAPTRRPLSAREAFGPRLENPVVDFESLPGQADWWRADAAICALGTTMRLAGSREAFARVDRDYVVESARRARAAGTPAFGLNSSLGADPASRNFYLRIKGEAERDVAGLGFESLTIVRPSLLEAARRPDFRPGEAAGLLVARLLGPLVPRRYRPVRTEAVARALLEAALRAEPGTRFIESGSLGRG